MLNQGQALIELKQRLSKQSQEKSCFISGKVGFHPKGPFLEIETGERAPLDPSCQAYVSQGDHVEAELYETHEKGGPSKKYCRAVTKLIKSTVPSFAVRLVSEGKKMKAVPFLSPWLTLDPVTEEGAEKLEPQEVYMASWETHPMAAQEKGAGRCRLVTRIGKRGEPFIHWKIQLAKLGLPVEQPFEYAQLEPLKTPQEAQDQSREDLTHLAFFTIDGAETQAMDDAICLEPLENNQYAVYVAITDVDEVLERNSELDEFARQLGETIYLPRFSVNMLPRKFAYGHCSLLPGEKRPAVVCRWLCDAEKHQPIQPVEVSLAWICSKAKLKYEEVSDWLEARTALEDPASHALQTPLLQLWKFITRLSAERLKGGAVFQEVLDYKYVVDEKGDILEISPKWSRSAHRLVEELMLFTNLSLTQYCIEKGGAEYCLFLSQKGLQPTALPAVSKRLEKMGLFLPPDHLSGLEGYRMWREWVGSKPWPQLTIQQSFPSAGADFSSRPEPHFSLGVDAYATWTSPIRKYSDLINLRWLKDHVFRNLTCETVPEALAVNLTEIRKSIRQARRAIHANLQRAYLKKKLFALEPTRRRLLFAAKVFQVNDRGVWVFLESIGAPALIPLQQIRSLESGADALDYDRRRGVLVTKSGRIFQIIGTVVVVSLGLPGLQTSSLTVRYITGPLDVILGKSSLKKEREGVRDSENRRKTEPNPSLNEEIQESY